MPHWIPGRPPLVYHIEVVLRTDCADDEPASFLRAFPPAEIDEDDLNLPDVGEFVLMDSNRAGKVVDCAFHYYSGTDGLCHCHVKITADRVARQRGDAKGKSARISALAPVPARLFLWSNRE